MGDELDEAVRRYLADLRSARLAVVSPLLAEDLHNLPAAVVFTAEYDPLRHEGEQYVARLHEAGVSARVSRHRGALHGTAMLTRTWPPAADWQREAADVLRAAHWPTGRDVPRLPVPAAKGAT
jgi:acetyl esterase